MLVIIPNGVHATHPCGSCLPGCGEIISTACICVLVRASVRLPGCSSSILLAGARGRNRIRIASSSGVQQNFHRAVLGAYFLLYQKNKKQCRPLPIKPPLVLRPSNSSPFLYFLSFFFLGMEGFQCCCLCVLSHPEGS